VGALIHCGWVECTVRDLDTSAGQMAAVREIMACQSDEEIRALLGDPAFVQRFEAEYERDGPANGAGGFEGMIVIDAGDNPALQPLLNRSLADIAAERGQGVLATLCDIALQSDLKLQLKSLSFCATDGQLTAKLLRHPGVAAGVSDGGAHTKAFSSGNYGTELLIRLVREQKVMTLEELHHQLSLKVARTLQLQDRGAILPGFWADLVIYGLDELYQETDRLAIVHDMPGGDWRRLTKSGGYHRILVNGVTTHIDDKATGAVPGQLLRVTRSPVEEAA
jgi:N-acyl-D-aspartate/D-glutamate deacylase